MMKTIAINKQNTLYQDCLNTPNLWHNRDVFNLQQIALTQTVYSFNSTIKEPLRLGKLVERFICHHLELNNQNRILAENVQIKNNKITIGELDCLLLQNENPIHLEIIYKFYVFDPAIKNSKLHHWIGPNRKDSLLQKLHKLKEKQLPLLYSNHTKSLLDDHKLKSETIEQMVCFKAQLFIPFESKALNFDVINEDCVKGFYIKRNQLEQFAECSFYMPKKIDWILNVNSNVAWINYSEFTDQLNLLLNNTKSPLCWIKNPTGQLSKCFVVWW